MKRLELVRNGASPPNARLRGQPGRAADMPLTGKNSQNQTHEFSTEWVTGSCQFVQQSLGVFQVRRVKAFGEPMIDREQEVVRLTVLAIVKPQPGETRRRAQLKRFRILVARYR